MGRGQRGAGRGGQWGSKPHSQQLLPDPTVAPWAGSPSQFSGSHLAPHQGGGVQKRDKLNTVLSSRIPATSPLPGVVCLGGPLPLTGLSPSHSPTHQLPQPKPGSVRMRQHQKQGTVEWGSVSSCWVPGSPAPRPLVFLSSWLSLH